MNENQKTRKAKTFEQRVKAMTAPNIILAMVRGLRRQWVKVDMNSYGHAVNGTCYGCAATNAVCEIAKKSFPPDSILDTEVRAMFVNSDFDFMDWFESAINVLRKGDVESYNRAAGRIGIAKIVLPASFPKLPYLHSYDLEENLPAYEALAKAQYSRAEDKKGNHKMIKVK